MKIKINKHIAEIRKILTSKHPELIQEEVAFDCLRGYRWFFDINQFSRETIHQILVDIASQINISTFDKNKSCSKIIDSDKKIQLYLSIIVSDVDYSKTVGHVLEITQLRPMKI